MNDWLSYLIDSLAFGATFMYGSTGEILTEKSGHLNLGIPGIMCMGGAGGCMMLNIVGRSHLPAFVIVLLGILAAFTMGYLMGMVYSFLTVTLRANQNVTGLTLTTFGVGLMKTLMKTVNSDNYLNIPKKLYSWPFADRTDALARLGVMFYLGVIIAIVASYVLYHTKVGLHLRAVGETPATADAVGINVTDYKYLSTCIGSGIAGLGGFYYIIGYMVSAEAYLSIEKYGWLSIALVIFALWRPHLTIPGSLVFGFLFSLSSRFANVSMAVKPLLQMLPYLVTILVLIITSIRNKRENQPPASLGMSYFREER